MVWIKATATGYPVWHAMPGFYRFTSADSVENHISGSLKFGHALKYRLLEILSQTKGVGDRLEGIETSFVRSEIRREPNVTMYLSHTSFISYDDCYILSMSFGLIDELLIGMKKFSGPYVYDSYLHINGITKLIDRIGRAKFKDGVISEYFDIKYNHCRYGNRNIINHVSSSKNLLPSDIFHKNSDFSYQKEFRIVLYPKSRWPRCDDLFVEIGDCSDLFFINHVDTINNKNNNIFDMNHNEAIKLLKKIDQDWKSKFPVPSEADLDEVNLFHERAMPIIGRAYGSIRFNDPKRLSKELDWMLTIPKDLPDHIYRELSFFVSDYSQID